MADKLAAAAHPATRFALELEAHLAAREQYEEPTGLPRELEETTWTALGANPEPSRHAVTITTHGRSAVARCGTRVELVRRMMLAAAVTCPDCRGRMP